jgi:hypothetical protein
MDRPSIRLYRPEGILDTLLVVLGVRLRLALAQAEVQYLAALNLFIVGGLLIDGARLAIGALVDVGHMVRRFVIADDVLPGVALLA